jgi:hypothetical protein
MDPLLLGAGIVLTVAFAIFTAMSFSGLVSNRHTSDN